VGPQQEVIKEEVVKEETLFKRPQQYRHGILQLYIKQVQFLARSLAPCHLP